MDITREQVEVLLRRIAELEAILRMVKDDLRISTEIYVAVTSVLGEG